MITVTMPDHTICKYDLQGKLIDDFYIVNVRMLEYEKDEIVYIKNNSLMAQDAGVASRAIIVKKNAKFAINMRV